MFMIVIQFKHAHQKVPGNSKWTVTAYIKCHIVVLVKLLLKTICLFTVHFVKLMYNRNGFTRNLKHHENHRFSLAKKPKTQQAVEEEMDHEKIADMTPDQYICGSLMVPY